MKANMFTSFHYSPPFSPSHYSLPPFSPPSFTSSTPSNPYSPAPSLFPVPPNLILLLLQDKTISIDRRIDERRGILVILGAVAPLYPTFTTLG